MNLYAILLAGSIATTTYDVETTFRTFDRCATCYEANPIVRPFSSNRASMYALQGGFTTGTAYASWKLKKDGKKYWWVPLAANIGIHVVAAKHNRGIR